MASFDSIESVQKSIELQKDLLQSTDDSIVKITGRLPDEERRNFPEVSSGASRRFSSNGAPKSVFSRLESSFTSAREGKITQLVRPDPDLNVSVHSSVVRVGEKRTRSDAIKEYKIVDRERGRRMFGILQATLSQFKAENNSDEAKKRKRRLEIESRIEAKAAEEKAAAKQERADLFRQRKQQQLELSLLEQKMRLMNEFETWKQEQLKMVDFILTEHGPPIFYRPKSDNRESEMRKSATKAKILERIEDRRRFLESEYAELASSRRRRLGIITADSESTGTAVDNSFSSLPHQGSPPSQSAPAPPHDVAGGSPQRFVHLVTKPGTANNNNTFTVDFEDLVDEPVLMDEETDHQIVATE